MNLHTMSPEAFAALDNNELDQLAIRQDQSGVMLKRAADVNPQPIRWLWPGYLAKGKIHILGGAPSAGKTTIALSLAATVSCGSHFPDGSSAEPGNVVIWSGEDDFSDTIVPRLLASGADLTRVHFVDGVREGGRSRAFDPARDMANLSSAIQAIGGASLLLVDPVVSAIAGDAHKNNDVRRGLQPLVDMVGQQDITALGITHFAKGTAGRDPTERIIGSVAFGAVARIVMVAAREAQDGDEATVDGRVFTRAKSNIGPDGGGFGYRIEQVELKNGIATTRTIWGDSLNGCAREILGQAESEEADDGTGTALAEACDFLKTELAAGQIAMKELIRRSSDAGISKATLKRAERRLGIKKEKVGVGKEGMWLASLPNEDP